MRQVTGVVETFDEQRGDGSLLDDDGQRFYFHCVAIADGSRRIDAGRRAVGTRAVGRLGHDEVVSLSALHEARAPLEV